mmetsp:Transcript_33038/g.49907  ORF Transcript_33038/g.49907 Transcript_33038/m.49907 type:complete len:89 (+) Transcript_33038:22-288(+)|eukprot:CAMPEP_0178935396 /NCGR_PEP_ID=MMETSP0786-20121207/24512_1 /TAXON_ID=186022 /ORGANISM="Thalassionema frauenfeldii, Strain CCMP 1798" /LENGTH=88 /DNA_ID=CAMNT_0020613519 /DNA_START=12 /DNA_END=278 /DNA_ORIENTATION=+
MTTTTEASIQNGNSAGGENAEDEVRFSLISSFQKIARNSYARIFLKSKFHSQISKRRLIVENDQQEKGSTQAAPDEPSGKERELCQDG